MDTAINTLGQTQRQSWTNCCINCYVLFV